MSQLSQDYNIEDAIKLISTVGDFPANASINFEGATPRQMARLVRKVALTREKSMKTFRKSSTEIRSQLFRTSPSSRTVRRL